MAVAAPADRRFRRAHVKPTRRRRLWEIHGARAVRVLVAVVVIGVVAFRGGRLLFTAPALQVSHIVISGNVRLSRGEVLTLLDGLRGRNMVTVQLESWRARLLKSPWVADAALRRLLPDTVTVAVSERKPMGIGRIGGELYLVDQHGVVIDEYGPNYGELDLPIIDGLASAPTGGGPMVDDRRAELASRVLDSLGTRRSLLRRVSEIDVNDARDAAVILKDETTLVRLGDEQFAEHLQTYLDLAPTIREHVSEIDYVDLRFDPRLYVRPVAHLPRGKTELAQDNRPGTAASKRAGRSRAAGQAKRTRKH